MGGKPTFATKETNDREPIASVLSALVSYRVDRWGVKEA